ncbi:MAG: class I adenylate-forming enzyme family protein [Streptosporangiaceae bacterium]
MLRQSESAGIIYVDAFRGTNMAAIVDGIRPGLSGLREAIRFADLASYLREASGQAGCPLPDVAPGDAAQLQYTSGTTGLPKGAVLHHRGLITNARYVHRRAQFPRGGTWATPLPLFHTAGCGMSVLGTADSLGTLVLAQRFEPTLVLGALQDWHADLLGAVPAMYSAMLADPSFDDYDLGSVAITASGGDAVPPALITEVERRFGSRFTTVYGQTELSPIVAQTSPDDEAEDRAQTVGRPLWQVEVKIADPQTGEPAAFGHEGEICARGYQAMLGYYGMPEETARTLGADGWLHTGDLGTMDERGYLTVTGRLKDLIIRGGEKIYPAEIEAVLLTHPAVAAAAVVGVPDEQWGEQVAAVIQSRQQDNPPRREDLYDLARELLAPHKTPRDFYLADALPVNAMGKVQKFLIRRQISDGKLPRLPGTSR